MVTGEINLGLLVQTLETIKHCVPKHKIIEGPDGQSMW